jgi:hypothetical protein
MTTQIKVINTGDKNAVVQMFVEGRGKHRKSDPIILKPGENRDMTIFPGLNFEVSEEEQDEPISETETTKSAA